MPLLRALTVAFALQLAADRTFAQFGPSGEQFARVLDRNGDGVIDPDELGRLPDRMLEGLEDNGIDTSRPISAEDLADAMSQRFEAMRAAREAGGDEASWDRGRSFGPEPSSRSSPSSSPAPAPAKRLTLPSEFASADTDRDGQVGYYEWRAWKGRAALAEFRSYDRNGDGFLTPRELALGPVAIVSPPVQTAMASASARPGTPSATVIPVSLPASAPTPSIPGGASSGSASYATPSGESTEESAHRFYGMIDKDKNGKLSMTEWEISRRIRGMFEADKLTLADMAEADFVSHYVRLSETSESSSDKSRGDKGRNDGGRRGPGR